MDTSGFVLLSVGLTYLLAVGVRYLKSRRRPVTLSDTLLANVLQNIGQH